MKVLTIQLWVIKLENWNLSLLFANRFWTRWSGFCLRLNTIFWEMEEELLSRQKECGGWLTGIVIESRILGTLEDADFNNINLVSPFRGEIVDITCECFRVASVPEVFVDYFDQSNSVLKQYFRPGWNGEELENLQAFVEKFRKSTKDLFDPC